ncbi:MAG TPA: SulP family inorganic anion transporter, partial [Pyrinomonadaceae bacterium]|nr:SulP family inorganic anion transporter [Pyrinomonadaceae bacterium]
PPVVGIYSCILPLVAYALLGSSRQLVVNPDAAACSIVAATVGPLAVGNPDRYLELSIGLTCFTGILLMIGGFSGLGAIANFLSRPILTGYLNGIALSIIAGQLGSLLGYKLSPNGFFRTVIEAVSRLKETQTSTFIVGLSLLVLLLLIKRFLPRLPAPLIAAILGCAAVYALDLGAKGVAIVGAVPAGFPAPKVPSFSASEIGPLALGAAGIALVSFCSMMTTARGFAAKNGYRIDVNRDMFALGVSDLASAVSQGFVVSGADSRTAVADSAGGKTQMTSIAAAVVMAVVLLFFTKPLAYVPIAALAAILMSSALGLFDIASLRRYYRISVPEFRQSVVATLGVMTVGVLPGVLIAVGLALLKLLRQVSRPRDSILGLVSGVDGDDFRSKEEGGTSIPGIVIYRFEASIVFFNADYFIERVRTIIKAAGTRPKYFLIDAESVPVLDVSGAYALEALHRELSQQGIGLGIARAPYLMRMMLERAGLNETIGTHNLYQTIHAGTRSFREDGRSQSG